MIYKSRILKDAKGNVVAYFKAISQNLPGGCWAVARTVSTLRKDVWAIYMRRRKRMNI
jgi:hypothetical protein